MLRDPGHTPVPGDMGGLSFRDRQRVGRAWALRAAAEREAQRHFERLAEGLRMLRAPRVLADRSRTAALDEARHAALCDALAARHGLLATPALGLVPPEPAPSGLDPAQAVLHELVAVSCVTESFDEAVLSELLEAAPPGEMRDVLQELVNDEHAHGQLGWTVLRHQHERRELGFLGELLPGMLAAAEAGSLARLGPGGTDGPSLLAHGVLPARRERQLFEECLVKVVFPHLREVGVETSAGQRWLRERRERHEARLRGEPQPRGLTGS